jgi:D-alanine-D-alanine ligase
VLEPYQDSYQRELLALEQTLEQRGRDLALLLVYDRPSRTAERPGLARTFFAQRCVSDDQLDQMIEAFRAIGAYVEVFEGERPFLAALAEGRVWRLGRSLLVAYNGIGWGIGVGGFEPGRKALIPLVADSYGLVCPNADAYGCVLTLHKFHCATILRSLGVRMPRTWHYRPDAGWIGAPPAPGTKIIAKSTFEAWSVGVTESSVFVVDDAPDQRVAALAGAIGQPVTVQEFVSGTEVYVPVLASPAPIALPPMEVLLEKAPGDPDAIMTIDDNLRPGAVTYRRYDAREEVLERLRAGALEVFRLLGLRGFVRVDFRVDGGGRPWVIDIAVSPGLELGGSGAGSLAECGFDHARFLRLVIAATLAERGLLSV